jgi:secreted PhoX family phosphatase
LVTFTATVTDLSAGGPIPNGGKVTFSDQNGVLNSETLVDGVATFKTSSLAAGTFTVTASYGGTAVFAPSVTGTIVTAAGNGTAGYLGDDGPATVAELKDPYGLAVDSAGNLFIADYGNNVVREVVEATGDIITVAGNGTAGYSGNNGPATAAELHAPIGLAFDSAGDLFIAEYLSNVVCEVVKSTGDIITVAGNGTAGYSGDNGPATAALLNGPAGLAFDSAGDLFIADRNNNVVREVVKSTGDIITVAGDGTAGHSGDNGSATAAELYDPTSVAVDSAGDLFISVEGNNSIREVVKASGDIINFTGDGTAGYSGNNGPATAAELHDPIGVAIDSVGDLFIVDNGNNVVREVVKATGDIITVAGNGTAGYAGDNGPATAAELNGPTRVAIDAAGHLFIADGLNNVVREATPAVTVTIIRTPTPTPTPIPTPTPTPTPIPIIIGEQVVTMRKKNKRGKPVGKPVLIGFTLDYSTAMNATTAGNALNYRVTSTTTKRVKKKLDTVFTPVAVTAVYNPSNDSVTLSIKGKPTFANGGQIKVIYSPTNGVCSASGVPLDASDSEFTILPKATRITPG